MHVQGPLFGQGTLLVPTVYFAVVQVLVELYAKCFFFYYCGRDNDHPLLLCWHGIHVHHFLHFLGVFKVQSYDDYAY